MLDYLLHHRRRAGRLVSWLTALVLAVYFSQMHGWRWWEWALLDIGIVLGVQFLWTTIFGYIAWRRAQRMDRRDYSTTATRAELLRQGRPGQTGAPAGGLPVGEAHHSRRWGGYHCDEFAERKKEATMLWTAASGCNESSKKR
jgi:hypothetical protein